MSGVTHAARPDEVAFVWPVVHSAHLMKSVEALDAYSQAGPWRLRVSDAGDAVLLGAWRRDLDVLAIRGLWAPARRVPDLVNDVCAVARRRGFSRVLSPLLQQDATGPYREAGMEEFERLVALSIPTGGVRSAPRDPGSRTPVVREFSPDDAESLAALDTRCFEEFWRYGAWEFAESAESENVRVAADDAGRAVGYAVSTLSGSTVTVARLAVAPLWRRAGCATALLCDADEWSALQGARGLSLCTQEDNTAARSLYRAAGFVEAPAPYRLLIRSA